MYGMKLFQLQEARNRKEMKQSGLGINENGYIKVVKNIPMESVKSDELEN